MGGWCAIPEVSWVVGGWLLSELKNCFLKKCLLSISSHSGATVHIAAAFNKPIIDFIKKSKANEYDRWIPPNIDYSRAFIDKLINLESSINAKI